MKTRGMVVMFFFFVIGVLIIGQASCGEQDSKIIGKWKVENVLTHGKTDNVEFANNKNTILEFFKDKTFIIIMGGPDYAGTWTLLEDGRIKLTNKTTSKVDIGEIKDDKIKIRVYSDCVFIFTR